MKRGKKKPTDDLAMLLKAVKPKQSTNIYFYWYYIFKYSKQLFKFKCILVIFFL